MDLKSDKCPDEISVSHHLLQKIYVYTHTLPAHELFTAEPKNDGAQCTDVRSVRLSVECSVRLSVQSTIRLLQKKLHTKSFCVMV
jgi:hypothetical protein